MARILRTAQSRQDYAEIWDHIAADNLVAADRLLDRFDDTLALLAVAPGIGRLCEELAPGLRSFPVGNYLIFYRPINDGIEFIRVLHGARDIPQLFNE